MILFMFDLHGAPAGIYKRASRDTAVGTQMEGMSVEGQDDEGRERAAELGAVVVDVYNDNNLPGSEFATKERGHWLRMLADIEAGKLRVIIMWDTSRGSRDLEDWVKFLKLIARHEVLVHAVSHERTYNPNNHRDWQVLAEDGVKNAAFSKQLSANVKRGFRRSAKSGRPRGTAAFGWRRVYDPNSGKMLTQEPVEELRKYVVEAFDRFVGGKSRQDLALEWNWRNRAPDDHPNWVPLSRDGKPWRHNSITNILRNPVYIGKLRDNKTGELLEGNWEGFIDEGVWWSAQRIMDASATIKDPRAKYLLTMIARCGRCGCRMSVSRARYYTCSGKDDDDAPMPRVGCTSMRMDWLDDVVVDALVMRLRDRDLIARLTESDSAAASEARRQALELRSELEAVWAKAVAREPGYTHDRVAQLEAAWVPEIERLEEEAIAGLGAGEMMMMRMHREWEGLTDAELDEAIRRGFDKTPLPGRRELIRTFTQLIRVLPSHRPGSRHFDPSRVEIIF